MMHLRTYILFVLCMALAGIPSAYGETITENSQSLFKLQHGRVYSTPPVGSGFLPQSLPSWSADEPRQTLPKKDSTALDEYSVDTPEDDYDRQTVGAFRLCRCQCDALARNFRLTRESAGLPYAGYECDATLKQQTTADYSINVASVCSRVDSLSEDLLSRVSLGDSHYYACGASFIDENTYYASALSREYGGSCGQIPANGNSIGQALFGEQAMVFECPASAPYEAGTISYLKDRYVEDRSVIEKIHRTPLNRVPAAQELANALGKQCRQVIPGYSYESDETQCWALIDPKNPMQRKDCIEYPDYVEYGRAGERPEFGTTSGPDYRLRGEEQRRYRSPDIAMQGVEYRPPEPQQQASASWWQTPLASPAVSSVTAPSPCTFTLSHGRIVCLTDTSSSSTSSTSSTSTSSTTSTSTSSGSTSVPEPAPLAFLGVAAAYAYTRRRKRSASQNSQ